MIDFEGEPTRSLSERKMKRCALRDVAGMMRSFHYAAHTALSLHRQTVRPEDVPLLEPWADHWANWISSAYLQSYLAAAEGALFIPDNREDTEALLEAFLLEKAVYEVGYELNNRPNGSASPCAASGRFSGTGRCENFAPPKHGRLDGVVIVELFGPAGLEVHILPHTFSPSSLQL